MTITTRSQSDHLIQEDVKEELLWTPQVNDARIGVSVLEGVVTLSGEVDSYTEKIAAGNAAFRVAGVTVVANDLAIRDSARFDHTDTEIAVAIKHVLEWATNIPHATIDVMVHDHVVVLTGSATWNYQRAAAERLIGGLEGVRYIDNRIQLTPRVSATDTSRLIKDALVRHALLDANAITINTAGSEVTLTGHVSTSVEKNAAAHAAWSSPHTTAVHNKILVRP